MPAETTERAANPPTPRWSARPAAGAGLARPLRRSRLWPYLAALGPGIVAAAAGNDAGGIATYSTVGAEYGYSLLWVMVI